MLSDISSFKIVPFTILAVVILFIWFYKETSVACKFVISVSFEVTCACKFVVKVYKFVISVSLEVICPYKLVAVLLINVVLSAIATTLFVI